MEEKFIELVKKNADLFMEMREGTDFDYLIDMAILDQSGMEPFITLVDFFDPTKDDLDKFENECCAFLESVKDSPKKTKFFIFTYTEGYLVTRSAYHTFTEKVLLNGMKKVFASMCEIMPYYLTNKSIFLGGLSLEILDWLHLHYPNFLTKCIAKNYSFSENDEWISTWFLWVLSQS